MANEIEYSWCENPEHGSKAHPKTEACVEPRFCTIKVL
jgi:hypothetical protein